MALVELRDVTRTVSLPDGEDLRILRGVTLDVEAGERVAIVGRSGTGKSTLLNIVGMLDRPTSGTYRDGVDAVGLREGRRARMRGASFGFVFQQFNIFAARTAVENVEVPLLYEAGPGFWRRRRLATGMLELVGLGDRADSYPSQMSGGEQQRIAIARALVRRPKTILADEPTGALDPHTGGAVMDLLESVAEENDAALITITHDMAIAARSHTVFELFDGVLHRLGSAADFVGGSPQEPPPPPDDGPDGAGTSRTEAPGARGDGADERDWAEEEQ